jgi:protein-L-isoaspartate O-methyltransferase
MDHPQDALVFVDSPYYLAEVIIGDNCWIGAGVTILPGATIGDSCIIGANSVVSRGMKIPDGVIAYGSPCRAAKTRNIPRERQAGDAIEKAHVERYALAAREVRHGEMVLDAGCGTGYGSKILADAATCKVVGVEISHAAAGQARLVARHPNVEIICEDLRAFVPGVAPDIITAFEIVEHVDDSAGLVGRLWSMLRPGGKMFISVPSDRVPATVNPFHRRHFSLTELRAMIQSSCPENTTELWCQWRGEEPKVLTDEVPDYYIARMTKGE